MLNIAIDIMGGDNAPVEPIKAIKSYLKSNKDIYFYLIGDKNQIIPIMGSEVSPDLYTIVHTEEKIDMNDKPSRVIKTKPNSSMIKCIELLRDKKVDSVISAGNTGALMFSSSLIVKRIPGVKKVILAPRIPNKHGNFILADVGANIDLKPIHFLDIANLCRIYYKIISDNKNPSLHLLNIGLEPNKGTSALIDTYKILEENISDFKGNIESRYLMTKKLNIVLCDGFIGNIVLKLTEGLSNYLLDLLKKTTFSIDAKNEIKTLKKIFNFESSTLLLGLNGIVLKCHGSSSSRSFKNAIAESKKLCEFNLIEKITSSFNK